MDLDAIVKAFESDDASAYQMAIAAAMDAAQQIDTGRWQVGDLAALVETKYGGETITDFAREIRIAKKRVEEYRTVARAYPNLLRTQIFEQYPNLTYSVLRTAMRFKNVEARLAFLADASDNHWTVDQADKEATKRLKGTVVVKETLYTGNVRLVGMKGSCITLEFDSGDLKKLLTVVGEALNITIWIEREENNDADHV